MEMIFYMALNVIGCAIWFYFGYRVGNREKKVRKVTDLIIGKKSPDDLFSETLKEMSRIEQSAISRLNQIHISKINEILKNP